MKLVKRIFILLVICFVGYGVYRAITTYRAQQKLFELLGEDLYLAIQEKINLVCDLLSWPVNFVKGLLP